MLLEAGVREVFHPGSTMDEITGRMRAATRTRRAPRAGADAGEPRMNKPVDRTLLSDDVGSPQRRWEDEYRATIGDDRAVENVSGIPIQPLYTPHDWAGLRRSDEPLGFPGQPDYTRGIYATMHRGRTWTQRQLDRPRHAGRLQRAPARAAASAAPPPSR